LDEGDDILSCIKQGMEENNLELVNVEGIDGVMREGLINYFEKNSFKSSVIKDKTLILASGSFKLNYGEVFGNMKIVTQDKPPMHGTLVRGKAGQDLTIKLAFLELVDEKK